MENNVAVSICVHVSVEHIFITLGDKPEMEISGSEGHSLLSFVITAELLSTVNALF
jgi:hypothetical protein